MSDETTTEHKYKLITAKRLKNPDQFNDQAIATIYYEDGVKKVDLDTHPTIRFRTTKLEAIKKYAGEEILVIPEADTEEVECPYDEAYDAIIDLQEEFDPESAAKNRKYLATCRQNRVRPNNLMLLNHVHGIDADLVDHYIGRFIRKYKADETNEDHVTKLNKCYFDIETDNYAVGRFVPGEEAITPVNAISFFDTRTHTLVMRLLDDSDPTQCVAPNPLIQEYKDHLEENRKELEDFVNENQTKIFGDKPMPHVDVVIKFYDNEEKLITEHYEDINNLFKPDYLMAFNQGFDHTFLMNRLEQKVGYAHAQDIIATDDIPIEYRNSYYVNDYSAKDVAKRNDKYSFATNYAVLDLQFSYFKIRESVKKPEETNLDYVLRTEIGITKVKHDDYEMHEFPYKDYKLFVKYSAIDTMGEAWMDMKASVSDTMIMLGKLSRTRAEKCLTKTIMLRNFLEYFWLDYEHLVMTNNHVKVIAEIAEAYEREHGVPMNLEPELDEYKQRMDQTPSMLDQVMDDNQDEDNPDDYGDEILAEEDSKVSKVEKKKKFRGAFVSDPNLMQNVGLKILDKFSKFVFDYVIDSDLSSLYPNLKKSWNMFVTTLRGKIYLASNVNDINFSARLADYIVSRNDIEIGREYFGLPSHEEFLKIFKEWQFKEGMKTLGMN